MKTAVLFWLLATQALTAPLVAAEQPAVAADAEAQEDAILSLAAYNVKADRIEDFGLRVKSSPLGAKPKTAVGFFVLAKFSPVITSILPNTAAARAGLQPGERILKSEGKSTVGGAFSTGKFGQWSKTQKAKWAQVAAGKTNVTWILEVEAPATKAVRTVKLVVPTPPPHWGASVWRPPHGRRASEVPEPGPLAHRSREVLDHGIWTLLDEELVQEIFAPVPAGNTVTGYAWELAEHRIFVTQFQGLTRIVLVMGIRGAGVWAYLTSPSGVLERAWNQGRKEQSGERPLAEAAAGFEHALDFWTTKVQAGTGRWPFEIKPGYDAAAASVGLAVQHGAPAPPVEAARPRAQDFLKLRPANEAERNLFADAYGKLGTEHDRWAYTETSRSLEDQRVRVMRVDPSKPEDERCVLLASMAGHRPRPRLTNGATSAARS